MPATLNGKSIISCDLSEPQAGVWTAVVDVDSEEPIAGAVTLVIDGVTWKGTVSKGDYHAGRVHMQIVGGAGKLATMLDTKHYRGGTLGSVVNDLMREAGETLSGTTDPRVRSHAVSRWSRPRGKASVALKQVSDELGLVWRVLRDGTVWLGSDEWAEAKTAHDEIDKSPGRDALLIAPEAPHLLPGVTFAGKRVSRVTTTTRDGGGLRQELLFESANGGSRVSEDLTAFVDQVTGSKIDYSRLYPSRVIRQSGDGTLEIMPDDPVIRGNGLTGVSIKHGVPGLQVTVAPGARIQLFFEGGDPKRPAAGLWADGSSVISAELMMTTSLKITAPSVSITGDVNVVGRLTAIDVKTTIGTSLLTHTHNSTAPGSPTSPPLPLPPPPTG
jgi:hypothetical protein